MFCPECGSENLGDAKFCAQCGSPLLVIGEGTAVGDMPSTGTAASAGEVAPAAAAAPAATAPAVKAPPAVIGAVALAIVLVAVAVFLLVGRSCASSQDSLSRISLVGPGLDAGATPVPVHFVGQDSAGNAVDETGYIDTSGHGISLPDGSYDMTFPASPIGSDGSLYRIVGVVYKLTVKDGAVVSSTGTGDQVITLEKEEPSQLDPAQIAAARDSAIEAGEDPGHVEELIEPVSLQVEKAWEGMPFGPSQLYRGKLYVGDVRTNQGSKLVTGIPNSVAPPVEAEQFLFADDHYLYLENNPGNGYAQVSIRRCNLDGSEDTALVSDALSNTPVFYDDGKVVYQVYGESGDNQVGVVDASTGESQRIDFGELSGLARLVGVSDGKAYLCVTPANAPTRIYSASLEGGSPAEALSLDSGTNVLALRSGVFVVSNGYTVTGRDTEGTQLWEGSVSDGLPVHPDCFSAGWLYLTTADLGTRKTGHIVRINAEEGLVEDLEARVPHLTHVMYSDGSTIYFCGHNSADMETIMGGSFVVFEYHLADGTIAEAGSSAPVQEAAPAEEQPAEAPAQDAVIKTKDFEFKIPQYWVGKVEWEEDVTNSGYATVTVFPTGYGDYQDDFYRYGLVTISVEPASVPYHGGDIGNARVVLVEGGDRHGAVYAQNWGYHAYSMKSGSSYSRTYSSDKVDVCLDLATCGTRTASDFTSESDPYCIDYLSSLLDGSLTLL